MDASFDFPSKFADYELIDSGGFEKLERFGDFILARPEPQALWKKSLSPSVWEQKYHARFERSKSNPEKGDWHMKAGMKESWWVNYPMGKHNLQFRLGMTAFKHVGIFPEQAINWEFIYQSTLTLTQTSSPKVLNLFGYTGGATLAAVAAGAETTHVDSVKQVVTWTKENLEASHLGSARWIVDDALKFVQKEVKREKKYEGIILDPPAYGRGPDGEKWILEEKLGELLLNCKQILAEKHFLVLNLYSLGYAPTLVETLGKSVFGKNIQSQTSELVITDGFGKKLPLGITFRYLNA